jgi:integrating conjugative element protein (TIGR03761 family)
MKDSPMATDSTLASQDAQNGLNLHAQNAATAATAAAKPAASPAVSITYKRTGMADSRGARRPVALASRSASGAGSSGSSSSGVGVGGSKSTSVLQGYDFAAEAAVLSAFLDAGQAPEIGHPLTERYALYMRNSEELNRLEEEELQTVTRSSANPEVPTQEAVKLRSMGALVIRKGDEDSMVLHTMEAMRIYLGVSAAKNVGSQYGVPGGVRAATALRLLFLLSQHDNPYAEWRLCEIDRRMDEIGKMITSTENKYRGLLDAKKVQGLNYSIVASEKTATVRLGYRSPYGYAVTNRIVEFDYCVRVLKSAERRALATREQVRQALNRIKHAMRSMFEFAITAARDLTQEGINGICRKDFFADADVVSVTRVAFASELFGAVPQDVFTKTRKPNHSLGYERVTGKEMEMLRQIALAQDSGGVEAEDTAAVVSALIE